jgi:hypothetical protein
MFFDDGRNMVHVSPDSADDAISLLIMIDGEAMPVKIAFGGAGDEGDGVVGIGVAIIDNPSLVPVETILNCAQMLATIGADSIPVEGE